MTFEQFAVFVDLHNLPDGNGFHGPAPPRSGRVPLGGRPRPGPSTRVPWSGSEAGAPDAGEPPPSGPAPIARWCPDRGGGRSRHAPLRRIGTTDHPRLGPVGPGCPLGVRGRDGQPCRRACPPPPQTHPHRGAVGRLRALLGPLGAPPAPLKPGRRDGPDAKAAASSVLPPRPVPTEPSSGPEPGPLPSARPGRRQGAGPPRRAGPAGAGPRLRTSSAQARWRLARMIRATRIATATVMPESAALNTGQRGS